MVDLRDLQTEGRNPKSTEIDQVSTVNLCRIINNEDATVANTVEKCIPVIASAIDALAGRVRRDGRVIYVGAGTSGRLGVIDASEIPPTYSAPKEQFVALIAGGDRALRNAQEGAEDDVEAAVSDLKALKLDGRSDSLIGIAASGRTPYVLSCLAYAKSLGCVTVGVSCSAPSAMSRSKIVDFMVDAVTGPEVVTGSTRMKAGTATKLILNMLSTGVMVKVGKTFGNMMVDLKVTNFKLQQRSRNILRTLCGELCPETDAELDLLIEECDGSVKLAMAALTLQTSLQEARRQLTAARGVLATVFHSRPTSQPPQIEKNGELPDQDYVLCVDGGGSKCVAVILGMSGEKGQGEAGGCNITEVGIGSTISSVSQAVERAIESHLTLRGKPLKSVSFSSIWIALAGFDRPGLADQFYISMSKLFDRSNESKLRLTNDIEILATAAAEKHSLYSAVVLVAGTGSVAMSYQRDKVGPFRRTGRAGGWGYLLGDDGSGFDVGRKGIRLALAEIDKANNANNRSDVGRETVRTSSMDPLSRQILQHFSPDSPANDPCNESDLLSTIIISNPGSSETSKRRIASAAKLVIEASPNNIHARGIVQSSAKCLATTLQVLLANGNPSNSVLVLAGGLMQSEIYRQALLETLQSAAIKFGKTEVVEKPAVLGAEHLRNEWLVRSE